MIAVVGGGSWGTALAWLLARRGHPVTLVCRGPDQAKAIRAEGRNSRYLPDLPLPEGIRAVADPDAARPATIWVIAVPTQCLRKVVAVLRDRVAPTAWLVLASKGLETGTGLRVSEVALAAGDPAWASRIAVLSGPNLAGELVREIPTTTVIASQNREAAAHLQSVFSAPFFRAYTNGDVTGVELGGALKNPIAIAAGISDGLGHGQNSKSALITRGLAEMTRLGVACGARAATFAGLSGLGDLVATCESPLSRNYRLGLALGQGVPVADALAAIGQVVEGIPTSEAACRLAGRHGVELPITEALRRVLFERCPPREEVAALMRRQFLDESGDQT